MSQLVMDFWLALISSTVVLPICVTLYQQIQLMLGDIQQRPEEHTFTPVQDGHDTGDETLFEPMYPIDAFPGARQFKTVYGVIHIFEWGPDHGEKVLLVHGLGTPCVALGDMAKELVTKGYRVMIYG